MNYPLTGLLNPATVVRHLKRRDKILGGILRETDQCPLFDQRVLSEEALFQRLARSIVGQQLSTRAASTIWGRVVAPATGRGGLRRRILDLTEGQAATAGLSRQKSAYLKALAAGHRDRQIRLSSLRNESDEVVIERLSELRGIGRWTSEMFLISCLKRLDVFSVSDAGLRRAMRYLYQLHDPSDADLVALAEHWRPYRSVASWHLWRALDNHWIK